MADGHQWELLRRLPHPMLRGAVLEYQGFRERVIGTFRRREIPSAGVTVIINLGPPLRMGGPETSDVMTSFADSFVAGLCTTYSLVETVGEMAGIEIRLTPTGARRLFGVAMSELANRVVRLGDVFGPRGLAAIARIGDAPTWAERFAVLDRVLCERLVRAVETPIAVDHAWRRLVSTERVLSVSALATELAWSQKRLVATFRDQVGLAPKQVVRLVRFQRAVSAMSRPGARLTAVAYGAGYYDQAHLIREVREFSGVSPGALVRQIHADGLGIIDS
jgi:AraC-like DNA-binding protein